MNKLFLTLLVAFFFTTDLLGQELTRDFEIMTPKYKVPNSLYKTIAYIDSRDDSSRIGVVGVGLLKNTNATLRLKTPVLPQLTRLIDSLTDSTAREGELLFQLRRFRFVEDFSTKYCYLNAALYVKTGASYARLSSLDTILVIRTAGVAKIIQRDGNKIITDFIAKGLLLKASDGVAYSISDIAGMDSLEKAQIPVYNTKNYTDGIYNNYTSFKNQKPDRQAIVDIKRNGSISSVKVLDATGKKIKIKSKDIYAVIDKGQIFITTEYDFYPVLKLPDNNFFFTGDIRDAASGGDIAGGQMALGLLGAALASSGYRTTYDLIIDHRTGGFIRLRVIPKPLTE